MKAIYAAVFADGIEMTMDALEAIAGERHLVFEDISIALAEVNAQKEIRAKRTNDDFSTWLPHIEEAIEPARLICPYR
ncbi:hypothetical protein [Paracoccus zhejiangensis]|uniref:Uncharacterized protein n=1 Tax=Paracoccus zhejiangensis TaxID=1077935 RepID=A0A2H5EXN3_9RHOB|nr:hypothetical protein [Paracoccus zhejiangensis]AUH64050.1 hypothetical protein CX676_07625 [Paracoccus zhejiangensis]